MTPALKNGKSTIALIATCSCTSAPMIRAGALLCASCSAPVVAANVDDETVLSQRDGERPLACSRARYLTIWARARAAGDGGAWRDGRARLMTRDAYERHARVERNATRVPASVVPSADDSALEELGLSRAS